MKIPESLTYLERKLGETIRDLFTHIHTPFENRLMASIDTLTQTVQTIQADIATIKANQQNQPPVLATQEQLDTLQSNLDGVKSDLDTIAAAQQPAPVIG